MVGFDDGRSVAISEALVSVPVNVDNFVRAETDRMFHDLQRDAGGVNRFSHRREPADVEHQTVIRLNRDTLYSFAVVDVRDGATLTIPEHGDRYVSAMVLDQDHLVRDVLHDPGRHALPDPGASGDHLFVAVRILVDPADADDVRAVCDVQDALVLAAGSSAPFEATDYDQGSLDETRDALLALASRLTDFDRMFGARNQVDPVRHLLGTAAGWGGLPSTEAAYVGVDPRLAPGRYALTMRDVPVDGFWSVSVYDAQGYFRPNELGVYNVNSVTAVRDDDGAVTVRFGDFPPGTPNAIPTPEGWNFLVRLYRPRAAVMERAWTVPDLTEVD